MVRAIDPSILVEPYPEAFPTTNTVHALRDVDVIIACVDRFQVRDDLNRLCKRYLIPMVDIGIEIARGRDEQTSAYAIPGRVTKVLADGPCLRCQGIVTDERLTEERGGQPVGYTEDPRVPDPAVVTLNGVVASLAATELLQLVTGFGGDDPPNCGWIFDGVRGSVEPVTKTYAPERPCEADRGRGDA
jgi:molybdopterin/thiamine biosynthesis adenylyltransferase